MSLQQSATASARWGWLLLACVAAGAQAADMPEASAAAALKALKSTPAGRHSYYTGGVHNTVGCLLPGSCVYPRKPGEPSDPLFPEWWVSDWTMYRIFNQAAIQQYPPPYASPPAGMSEGQDYEKSYGASYYDASYVPADGDGRGAMMEHYEKRCLPIFPGSNQYSCSFVSLGNKAYFLRYADRPKGTPQCCQFSLDNHPPRRDFIKHLPYNAEQSTHLNGSVQAYSRIVQPGSILFGYAFYKQATRDGGKGAPYRHPQSFFFSGDPGSPPDAPMVSQNYSNFRAQRPDPKRTWLKVAEMCPAKPEWCCLFATDCPDKGKTDAPAADKANAQPDPSWATLQP